MRNFPVLFKGFKAVLAFALLIVGLYFSKEALKQYIEDRSAFEKSYETITSDDIPVISVGFTSPTTFCDELPDYEIVLEVDIDNVKQTYVSNSSLKLKDGWISAEQYCFSELADGQYFHYFLQKIFNGGRDKESEND